MIPEPPPPAAPEPMAAAPAAPPSPWGPGATIGLLLLIIVAVVGAQTVIALAWLFLFSFDSVSDPETLATTLQFDGDLLAVTTLVGAVVAVGVAALLVRSRGATLSGYLALAPVRPKAVFLWILVTLAFLASYDLVSMALDRPTVPDFMVRAYESARFLPLLWVAVALVAPLWEEAVFRGFGFRGLRSSRFGAAAAIGLPTLLWACLHLQYDAFDIAYVFGLGVLFGIARERTGSVTMPIVLHILTNTLATLQVALR